MSSSEVLRSRSARYARTAALAGSTGRVRPPVIHAVNPRQSSPVAAHRAAPLIRDLPTGAESQLSTPGLADGFPLTALDAVGARLLALRARLRGRTDP